jgi:hypothetical protein
VSYESLDPQKSEQWYWQAWEEGDNRPFDTSDIQPLCVGWLSAIVPACDIQPMVVWLGFSHLQRADYQLLSVRVIFSHFQ